MNNYSFQTNFIDKGNVTEYVAEIFSTTTGEIILKEIIGTIKEKNDGRFEWKAKKSRYISSWGVTEDQQGTVDYFDEAIDSLHALWN